MLMIDNDTVAALLDMRSCIEAQEAAFRQIPGGGAAFRGRIDMYAPCERPDGYYRWGTMEGYNDGILAIRMKSDVMTWPRDERGRWTEDKYCVEPGTYCGLIFLWSALNGEPLAMINDGVLQHMRVGGGAGIGVRHLSRPESAVVGMLGSGGMARTYLEAICAVRDISEVRVYSPTRANRGRYAAEMAERLSIPVAPVDSAKVAMVGADIVASATDSMEPTFDAAWLEPGMHVTNLGPDEMSPAALDRFDVKIRQGVPGIRMPESERMQPGIGHSPMAVLAGTEEELKRLPPRRERDIYLEEFPTYCDLVTGQAPGRTAADQVTFYQNTGFQGLQFSSVGGLVYRRAKEAGLGREIPTEWFLQDIRD